MLRQTISLLKIKRFIIAHEFRIILALFVMIIAVIFIFCYRKYWLKLSGHNNGASYPLNRDYLAVLDEHKEKSLFPYRYLKDDQDRTVPIVLLSGFFRGDNNAHDQYYKYIENGIKVVGITAYKTFPKRITDASEDRYHWTDGFDYTKEIKNWMCCFKDPSQYGFTSYNRTIDISESDFYDVDDVETEKLYDVIYICLSDHPTPDNPCPMDGWNAINRNYRLAEACFPIMINEYHLKVLVVGRIGCGLEEKYGDNIEVVDFLPYHEFQEKIRQSRILFVPNIYDASPRVVAESITKGLTILMNREIVCGSKYVTEETGELFTDENDVRYAIEKLLAKQDDISPKQWWKAHYGTKVAGKRMCDFLKECYPGLLGDAEEVHF